MILPGWTCSCGVFSGEGKERIAKCRACGKDRPEVMSWERAREAAMWRRWRASPTGATWRQPDSLRRLWRTGRGRTGCSRKADLGQWVEGKS